MARRHGGREKGGQGPPWECALSFASPFPSFFYVFLFPFLPPFLFLIFFSLSSPFFFFSKKKEIYKSYHVPGNIRTPPRTKNRVFSRLVLFAPFCVVSHRVVLCRPGKGSDGIRIFPPGNSSSELSRPPDTQRSAPRHIREKGLDYAFV